MDCRRSRVLILALALTSLGFSTTLAQEPKHHPDTPPPNPHGGGVAGGVGGGNGGGGGGGGGFGGGFGGGGGGGGFGFGGGGGVGGGSGGGPGGGVGGGGGFVPILIPTPVFLLPDPCNFGPGPRAFPNQMGGGLWLPSPIRTVSVPNRVVPGLRAPIKRPEVAKAAELVKRGDRLFRAALYPKAEERYAQAIKADPKSAAPQLRLAQIALIRGRFADAADRFRAAQASEPGWLVNAADIRALYAEPGDFDSVMAKLETQVQAHPGDRDAWLSLGAELFLSGHIRQSSDVFARLADRKVDATLAAFIDASVPVEPPKPTPAQP